HDAVPATPPRPWRALRSSIVGPDGAVFTLNGGALSAMGNLNGVGVALTSNSIPDVRRVVTRDSLTFTVTVTDTAPTGTVTLQDTVYSVPSPGVLNSRTTLLWILMAR